MTIPAEYTLTEAHMKIAELERRLEAAEAERDAALTHAARSLAGWKDAIALADLALAALAGKEGK